MLVLMFGPQGSGKGTQADLLSRELKIPHISTGDLFRSLSGELKEKVDALINKGNLVPDELTLDILKERIARKDCKKGFILDGFPRNLNQAKILGNLASVDKVIEISVPDGESMRRILGRVVCEGCGKMFNYAVSCLNPKKEGVCDSCLGKLVRRKDDYEESVKKRLEIYHNETEPVLVFYGEKAFRVDGIGTIEEVSERIQEIF